MMSYSIEQGKLFKKKHLWDFKALKWWSRIFEYQFLQEAVNELNKSNKSLSVLDVATGPFHPGSFILENGFNKVDAVDLLDKPKIFKKFNKFNINYIKDDMINTKLNKTYDLVVCISTLEHVKKEDQKEFLLNMIKLTKKGGALILTFDDPGFEELTDIELYKETLRGNNCLFEESIIPEDKILTNLNGPIKRDFFKEGHTDKDVDIKVYKMFITKT
ncbi:class I SAM-dependent methyltransferase [Rosistilla oblonga]|uniref:class I SAM-dependent methyltransferase n=1 Tax=Rosistilla oblonga TaxID=2527990 RepID=UPI003A96CC1F